MSAEEKKEEAKEHSKEKAEAKEKPKAEKAAAPASAPAAEEKAGPKRIKLSRLSIKDLDEKIKVCQEKMGGLKSRYGRFLLARKRELSKKPA